MKTSRLLALATLVIPLLVAGCGGGGTHTTVESNSQTLGKQLTDLDQAYKSGAMTKSEYEKARKKILDNYNYK